MSFPTIPNVTPSINLSRADVVNLLLASIAFEELGLAHVINAEAEKIQAVLGTLPGLSLTASNIDQLLSVNQGVNHTLQTALKTQMLLQFKLEDILEIPTESTTTTTTTTTTSTTSSTTTTTTGVGDMIPFSSGTPVSFGPNPATGGRNTVGLIAFGTNASLVPISTLTIDLGAPSSQPLNEAFVVPRNGTITSIAAFFSTTQTVQTTTGILVRLFQSTGTTFTPLAGASVTLPSLAASSPVGTATQSLATGLSIPVIAGTRLLMVFSSPSASSTGYASGGVNII